TGRLGREYLPEARPPYKAKKSAQEAHEAIRPSSVAREPKVVARFLSKDQLALYRLIWERFLASRMVPAVYDTVAADIEAGRCIFRAQGPKMKFAGFTAVYGAPRGTKVKCAGLTAGVRGAGGGAGGGARGGQESVGASPHGRRDPKLLALD